MSRSVVVRSAARRDIDRCADYIGRTSRAAGRRFFGALQATVERLVELPGPGAPYEIENEFLQGLRLATVQGFENHLVFYLFTDEELILVRILHGALDVEGLLEQEG